MDISFRHGPDSFGWIYSYWYNKVFQAHLVLFFSRAWNRSSPQISLATFSGKWYWDIIVWAVLVFIATGLAIVSRPFALDSGFHHPPEVLLAVMNTLDPPSSPLCTSYPSEGRCAPFASPGPTVRDHAVSCCNYLCSATLGRDASPVP